MAATDPPESKRWHGDLTPAQTRVAAISASPLVGERRQGGMMAVTSLEDHGQGLIIRKNVATRPGSADVRDPDEQADAEQLGVLVAGAVGLRAPAVLRTGQHELEMEYIHGETGSEDDPYGSNPVETLKLPDWERMSVLDASINNFDRNEGNYVMTPNGRVVPIDHSMSFYSGPTEPVAAVTQPLTITQTEAADMRAQIEALRPEFDRIGRGEWLDDTLARFDALQFAPDPKPAAQNETDGAPALQGSAALDAAPADTATLAPLAEAGFTDSEIYDIRQAFLTYQGGNYQSINETLLGKREDTRRVRAWIDRMDVAMTHSPLTSDVEVFRGERNPSRNFPPGTWNPDGGMEGAEWSFPSFGSTSADPDVASTFALTSSGAPPAPGAQPTVFRLKVRKGTPAVNLNSKAQHESELLLDRGLRYRVTKDHGVVDGVRRLDVEVFSP